MARAGNDRHGTGWRESRQPLDPAFRCDRVVLATQDEDRRLDPGQLVLDPVVEHRASGLPLPTDSEAHVVDPLNEPEAKRFVREVARQTPDMLAQRPGARVGGWADHDEVADQIGPAHRQIGNDLAAERIADQNRALDRAKVQPAGEQIGQIWHIQHLPRRLTQPITG